MSIEEVVDVESDGEAAIGVFATEVDDAAGGHLLLSIELFDQFINPVHIVFVCIHILYVEGFKSFYGHIIRLIVVLEIDKVGFLAALKKKVRVECEVGVVFHDSTPFATMAGVQLFLSIPDATRISSSKSNCFRSDFRVCVFKSFR